MDLAQSAVAKHAAQESHAIDWEGGFPAAISPEMPIGVVARSFVDEYDEQR